MNKSLEDLKGLLKKTEAGSRIVILYENLILMPDLFLDEKSDTTIRTEAGRVIFDENLPISEQSLWELFFKDSDWNIKRWAALFLKFRFSKLPIYGGEDWRVIVFLDYLRNESYESGA